MLRFFLFITIITCCLLIEVPNLAAEQDYKKPSEYALIPENFNPDDFKDEIKLIENYLSNFKTLSSRFEQSSGTQGIVSRGKIYISRPGKARWEYIEPSRVTLIIKKGRLSYYNADLDQISYGDIPPTPLEILLYKNVTFSKNIKVVNIMNKPESLTIVVAPTIKNENPQDDRALALIFSRSPTNPNDIKLKRLERTNHRNHTVSISLLDPKFDKELNKELFMFKNPKLEKMLKSYPKAKQ